MGVVFWGSIDDTLIGVFSLDSGGDVDGLLRSLMAPIIPKIGTFQVLALIQMNLVKMGTWPRVSGELP